MIRVLAYGLLAAAVLATGFYFYQVNRIENRLDEIATQLGPVGRLEYRRVSLSPGGEIRVHDLAFRPNGMDERVEVKRLAIRAESLPAILQVGRELDAGRMPAELGIGLEGLMLAVDGEIFASLYGDDDGARPGLQAAGCGHRRSFSNRDLTSMGYWDLLTDLDLSYRLAEGGESLDLSLDAFTHEMSRISLDGRLNLEAGSRELEALGMAMTSARLETLTVDYQDHGYYPNMLQFCAEETGQDAVAYRQQHLAAWEETWRSMGFSPGESTLSAYQSFLESPDRIRLTAAPARGLPLAQVPMFEPNRLVDRLDMRVAVNGESFGRLNWHPARSSQEEDSPEAGETTSAGRSGPTNPAPAPGTSANEPEGEAEQAEPSPFQSIRVSRLEAYEDEWVHLTLNDGKEWQGRVVEVGARQIRLERHMSGGYFVVSLNRGEIVEVRVRR